MKSKGFAGIPSVLEGGSTRTRAWVDDNSGVETGAAPFDAAPVFETEVRKKD